MLLFDRLVHLPGNTTIAEVSSNARPQLRDIQGFGEVHLEHRPATRSKRQAILRRLCSLGNTAITQLAISRERRIHRSLVLDFETSFGERRLSWTLGLFVAMQVGEALQQLHAAAMTM